MATADFRKQVMAPITMADLTGTARLRLLLLPNPDGVTDIRLLDSNRFRKHLRGGGMLLSRQQMERLHTHVFSTEQEVEALLADMEADTGKWARENTEVVTPPIASLSYAWIQADDPDPNLWQMQRLAWAMQWLEAQRIAQARLEGVVECFRQKSERFAVMVDFASIYQVEGGQREPWEQASFDRALRNVGLLFAHSKTMTLKISNTPVVRPERIWSMRGWKVLKKSLVNDPDRVYERRGWTALERRLADLVSRREYTLDLSLWEKLDETVRGEFDNAGGTEESEDDLLEKLLVNSHLSASFPTQANPVLQMLSSEGGCGVPVCPADFAEEARQLAFAVPSDLEACAGIYKRAATPVLDATRELRVASAMSDEQLAQLGPSLALHGALRTLALRRTGMRAAQLAGITAALAAAGSPRLTELDVSDERLEAGGGEALAAWLESGRLGSLRRLSLARCGLGAAGCKALAGALHKGVGASLEGLRLEGEAELGDAYGQALGGLFPAFAATLPALTALRLDHCALADGGCELLAKALEKGAMARLEALGLRNVEMGEGGCAALAVAVHQTIGRQLRTLDLSSNRIGDGGVAALLGRQGQGSAREEVLPALEELGLHRCEVWDESEARVVGGVGERGWRDVERALREGCMARLKKLGVSREVRSAWPVLEEELRRRGGTFTEAE